MSPDRFVELMGGVSVPKRVSRVKERLKAAGVAVWAVVAVVFVSSGLGGVAYAQQVCEYDVEFGDTLTSIAAEYQVTVAHLTAVNGISDPDLIRVGDCLQLDVTVAAVAGAVVYEDATEIAGGPQPGTQALLDAVLTVTPDGWSLGIYNPRPKRGGSSLSLHAEGRAADIGYADCDVSSGWRMTQMLVEHHEVLGVQRVLFCDVGWDVREGWFEPSQGLADLHNGVSAPTHIHVEQTRDGASSLTVDVALGAFTPPVLFDAEPEPEPEPEPVIRPPAEPGGEKPAPEPEPSPRAPAAPVEEMKPFGDEPVKSVDGVEKEVTE